MKAQVITSEYADQFPMQAWARVVQTASTDDIAIDASVEKPRKARDRGASAVEWVVITGIVVAIVVGVGVVISKAIGDKAKNTCNQIGSAGNNLQNSTPAAGSGNC